MAWAPPAHWPVKSYGVTVGRATAVAAITAMARAGVVLRRSFPASMSRSLSPPGRIYRPNRVASTDRARRVPPDRDENRFAPGCPGRTRARPAVRRGGLVAVVHPAVVASNFDAAALSHASPSAERSVGGARSTRGDDLSSVG